jgi:hypothetical protein
MVPDWAGRGPVRAAPGVVGDILEARAFSKSLHASATLALREVCVEHSSGTHG